MAICVQMIKSDVLLYLAHTDLYDGSVIGILSSPGDGMVIITLLTQVRKEKNGKINFHPGIGHPV